MIIQKLIQKIVTNSGLRKSQWSWRTRWNADIPSVQHNEAPNPELRGEEQRSVRGSRESKPGEASYGRKGSNGLWEWVRRTVQRGTVAGTVGCLPNPHPHLPRRARIFSNISSFTRLSFMIEFRLVLAKHPASIPVTSLGMKLWPPVWSQEVCWGFLGKIAFFLNRHTLEGWPSSPLSGCHHIWISYVERLDCSQGAGLPGRAH